MHILNYVLRRLIVRPIPTEQYRPRHRGVEKVEDVDEFDIMDMGDIIRYDLIQFGRHRLAG
jgi:hypothetical protein